MNDPKKEFIKTIETFRYKRNLYDVFRDFCEMYALAISNTVFPSSENEKRYLDIAKNYSKDEINSLCKLASCVIMGLENEYGDFLGEIFSELELHNHWHGQFFTPYHVSKLMAQIVLGDAEAIIEQNGFITVCEPACGAGSMVIACADALRAMNINFQKKMHVTATDICPTAAHMTYIQISLLHIPAIVYIGDTLALKMRERFFTPAHVLGFWSVKLQKRLEESQEIIIPTSQKLQMSLFK
jgi:type I restriction-modification system DNA methylase subunit